MFQLGKPDPLPASVKQARWALVTSPSDPVEAALARASRAARSYVHIGTKGQQKPTLPGALVSPTQESCPHLHVLYVPTAE